MNKDITPLPPAQIISVTPSHREQSRKSIENNKQAKKNKGMSPRNNFATATSTLAPTTTTTMTSPTPLDTGSPINPIKSFSPQPDPLTITITPSSATHAGEMSADPSHRDLPSHDSLALSPKSTTSSGMAKSESGASLPPAELPIVECPSTARLISPHDIDGIDIKTPLTEDPLSPPSSVRFEQQEYTPSSISSYPVTPNERDSVSAEEECSSRRSLSRASNRELLSREEEEQKMREHEMVNVFFSA